MSCLIHSARLVSDGVESPDAWVLLADGVVAARGTGDSWREAAQAASVPSAPSAGNADADAPLEIIDATEVAGPGAILTPGFIDIHGHGGAGRSYDDGVDDIRLARALHRAHGTTRAVISLVTGTLERLEHAVAVIADLTESDPDILGSHLEGPFLAPARKGAHTEELLTVPTTEAVARLLEAGRGTVRQVTIAPELPGGADAVRAIVAAGAAAAVGHTTATYAQARAAFDDGATVLTHAFNAMEGLHHRDPGPVGAALADDRVTLEVIADGVHVHPEVIRMLCAATPGRIALVTDAMAAAGAADGHYDLGGLAVTVADGVARLANGTIAGSTLTQDEALRRAVASGIRVVDAVDALTTAPARAIARPDLGSLAVGKVADAVLLGADFDVKRVWTAGVPA